MADLAKMFGKKAEPHEQPNSSDDASKASANESTRQLPNEAQSESIPRSTTVAPAKTGGAGNPFARRTSGGTKDSGAAVDGGSTDSDSRSTSGDSKPRPKLAGINLGTAARPESDTASEVGIGTLDSLESLDQLEDEGTAPRRSVISSFTDETPADKPTRELPETLTKEELGFIDMIDGVYEVLHEPDLLGSVIRNIIIELKSHPEYMRLTAPDDIRAWVRGMRESMGLAKVKKQETKAKKSGGAGRKSKLVDDDMLAALKDIGLEGLE